MSYKIPLSFFDKPNLQLRNRVNPQKVFCVVAYGSISSKLALILCQYLKSINSPVALLVAGSPSAQEYREIRKKAHKIVGRDRSHIIEPQTTVVGSGKSIETGCLNLPAYRSKIAEAKEVADTVCAKARSVGLVSIQTTGGSSGGIGTALFEAFRPSFTYSVAGLMSAPDSAKLCQKNQMIIEAQMKGWHAIFDKHINFRINNPEKIEDIDIASMGIIGGIITKTEPVVGEDYELSDLYSQFPSSFYNLDTGVILNPTDSKFNPFPLVSRVPNRETSIFQAVKLVSRMEFKSEDTAYIAGLHQSLLGRVQDEAEARRQMVNLRFVNARFGNNMIAVGRVREVP